MTKILCVDDAIAFLKLCESGDEEFGVALTMLLDAWTERGEELVKLRKTQYEMQAEITKKIEAKYKRKVNRLEFKIDDLQGCIGRAEQALRGDYYE